MKVFPVGIQGKVMKHQIIFLFGDRSQKILLEKIMYVSRCFQYCFNGNMEFTVKSIAAEMKKKKNNYNKLNISEDNSPITKYYC